MKQSNEELKESEMPQTLYECMGGESNLKRLVDLIFENVQTHEDLNKIFSKVKDHEFFKEKFKIFFTFLTGGSKFWVGKSMKDAHKGLHINDELFDAFVSICIN